MSLHVVRRFCPDCGSMRPFEKATVNHVLHLVLSLITLGAWLLVWGFLVGLNVLCPYRCRVCGKARH